MSVSLLAQGGNPTSFATGSTKYFAWGMGEYYAQATQVRSQTPVGVGGTVSGMYIYWSTNNYTASSTLNFQVGGSNGNQNISITASTSGAFQDTTNTDVVTTGNLVNYLLTTSSSGSTSTVQMMSTLFAASVGTVVQYMNANLQGGNSYNALGGPGNGSATLAYNQIKMQSTGTLKYAYVYVQANPYGGGSSFNTQINGSYGNVSASIPSLTTGLFQDTTNSDSVSNGSLVNLYWSNWVSATVNFAGVGLSTSNYSFQVAGGDAGFPSLSAGNGPWYWHASCIANYYSGDSTISQPIGIAGTFSNLWLSLQTNSLSSSLSGYIDLNQGTNSNNHISVASATTGNFEDTTHTDTTLTSTGFNLYIANMGGTGSYKLGATSILFTGPAPTPTGNAAFFLLA